MSIHFRRHRWRPVHALRLTAAVAALSTAAIPAAAQTADRPTAGWQNGFFVQSADGENRLQIGLLAQFDGRFAPDDEAGDLTDTFALRRLRPTFRGTIGGRFDYRLTVETAGGTFGLLDAYVDTRFSPALRVRVGKAKSPISHERLLSAASILFLERAFPSGVGPNRDVGVQVLGDVAGGRVSYIAGILNGSRDGSSSDTDSEDAKDLAGRLVVRPVDGLSLALAGSTGTVEGASALPTYRTTIFQQTFFSYAGAVADGRRSRYSPSVAYYSGPFGAVADYVHSEIEVTGGAARADVGHDAWQVSASWVLTGEDATEGGVVPRANFGSGDAWGAFQVAARYQAIEVDRIAFDAGLAAPGANRKAEGWTVGLNWYLNRHLLYKLNVERTVFDDNQGARPAENVLAFRSQINF